MKERRDPPTGGSGVSRPSPFFRWETDKPNQGRRRITVDMREIIAVDIACAANVSAFGVHLWAKTKGVVFYFECDTLANAYELEAEITKLWDQINE